MVHSIDSIKRHIRYAANAETLRALRDDWHRMYAESPNPSEIRQEVAEVNEIHDSIIRRTVFLAECALRDRGMGPPPVSYAFLLFGSGGRSEQTLWSDQDNGMVYEDVHESMRETVERYFREFALEIAGQLEQVGYPPCDGKVGVAEPEWRQPISGWLHTIERWFAEPNWENVRYLLILADMRSVAGKTELVEGMRAAFYERTVSRPAILGDMLNNTLRHKIMLNLFGQLIAEPYGEDAGSIDVKYGGYIPIVNAVRLLAILMKSHCTSTLDRIAALEEHGMIPAELRKSWEKAFCQMLAMRARSQYKVEAGLYTTTGMIKASGMDKTQKDLLKEALRTGKQMQKFVQKQLHP